MTAFIYGHFELKEQTVTAKSLLIEIDGVEIVSADESGWVDYAPGYTGSKVVKALAMAGAEALESMDKSDPNRCGMFVSFEDRRAAPAEPAKPTEPPTSPAKPKVVSIRDARDEVDRLVMAGAFGDVHPAKKFLEAVQTMQRMLGTYHDPEFAEDTSRPALGETIKQGFTALDVLSVQAPAGEAQNAFNAYAKLARKEFTNPAKHEGAPNLTEGDTDVKGDMTQ